MAFGLAVFVATAACSNEPNASSSRRPVVEVVQEASTTETFASVAELAAYSDVIVPVTTLSTTRDAPINRHSFIFRTVQVGNEVLKGDGALANAPLEVRQEGEAIAGLLPLLDAGKSYVLFLKASSVGPHYEQGRTFLHVRGIFERFADGTYIDRNPQSALTGTEKELTLDEMRASLGG